MAQKLDRRSLLKVGASAGVAMSATALAQTTTKAANDRSVVRIGVVGTGGRGTGLMQTLLKLNGVEVPAVCDVNEASLKQAQDIVAAAGRKRPDGYGDGPLAYQKLCERDDLHAVLITTPWELHTPVAIHAMQAGKYPAVEVPAAVTIEECWALVNTSEQTGVPCMMLENWSFRRDNLAVLNMIRKGLLGTMVHCHCAHSHDCIDHWFFDRQGNDRWPARYLINHNRDQYPTHSLGPVLSWLDINCGDVFGYLTATATDSRAINEYFARKFGPAHPSAKRKYAQGDIVTSVVRTKRGKSIAINYDMQLPRPYDNRWMVQGTLGIYNEQGSLVYLSGISPKYHEWESFAPYQKEYDHTLWKSLQSDIGDLGHGGTDYIELQEFVKAVRAKTQTPIDVYDSVTMCCIIGLSELSIARGSAPVECPDFTRGKWQTRKPTFAADPDYPPRA
ncbi:MAG TPA: Gfo/Idh/MocA family oxidoreductase [Phycisphaerae bacterium]|nr:Gfo/Idh/MocA family oxidoreductase [Phycisphaerae bacterium]